MALTPKQIKNLKPGDIVDVRGFVNLPLCNGNILVELRHEFDHRILPAYKQISTEFISIPGEPEEKPKYDPCRLFRAGDIAKPRLVNNRPYSNYFSKHTGVVVRVLKDEDPENKGVIYVDVPGDGEEKIDPAYLELVAPVEELEPYSVLETDTINGFDIMRDGLCVMTFPYGSKEAGYYRNEPAAKEAAEAEAARLNAEYRKNHEND